MKGNQIIGTILAIIVLYVVSPPFAVKGMNVLHMQSPDFLIIFYKPLAVMADYFPLYSDYIFSTASYLDSL